MKHRVALYPFLLLAISCLIVPSATAQMSLEAVELRTYDVGSITAPLHDSSLPNWQLQLRGLLNYDEDRGTLEEATRLLSIDSLIELLRDLVDPRAWEENPSNSIQSMGGSETLVISATAAQHTQIQSLLTQIGSFARATVDLQFFLVNGAPGAMESVLGEDGTLGKESVASLATGNLSGINVEGAFTARARAGQRITVTSGEKRDVVLSANVEVAQEASAVDPRVSAIFSGIKIAVRPDLLPGGFINVRIVGSLSAAPDLQEISTGSQYHQATGPADRATKKADVQLVSQPVVSLAQSPTFMNGHGAVLALGGDSKTESHRHLVVVAESEHSWMETIDVDGGSDLTILRSAALTRPRLLAGSLMRGPMSGDRFMNAAESSALTTDNLVGILSSDFEESGHLAASGNHVLMVCTPDVRDRATQKLNVIAKATKPRLVEVRLLETTTAVLDAAKAGGNKGWLRRLLQSPATKQHLFLSGGLNVNGMAQWTAGTEFTYLANLEVEIAQKATILNPVIKAGFCGFEFRVRLRDAGQGNHSVEFESTIDGARLMKDMFAQGTLLAVQQAQGSLDLLRGTRIASGNTPCILDERRHGGACRILVLEVK